MKHTKMYVHPDFKFKLSKVKAEMELKENRNISFIELTKNLDITAPFEIRKNEFGIKKHGKKRISF